MIFCRVGGNTYRGQTIVDDGILTIRDPLSLGAGATLPPQNGTSQAATIVNFNSVTGEAGTLQFEFTASRIWTPNAILQKPRPAVRPVTNPGDRLPGLQRPARRSTAPASTRQPRHTGRPARSARCTTSPATTSGAATSPSAACPPRRASSASASRRTPTSSSRARWATRTASPNCARSSPAADLQPRQHLRRRHPDRGRRAQHPRLARAGQRFRPRPLGRPARTRGRSGSRRHDPAHRGRNLGFDSVTFSGARPGSVHPGPHRHLHPLLQGRHHRHPERLLASLAAQMQARSTACRPSAGSAVRHRHAVGQHLPRHLRRHPRQRGHPAHDRRG